MEWWNNGIMVKTLMTNVKIQMPNECQRTSGKWSSNLKARVEVWNDGKNINDKCQSPKVK